MFASLLIWLLFAALCNAQSPGQCEFNPPDNQTAYSAATSLLRTPYFWFDDIGYEWGWKGGMAGINDNGDIYLIAGILQSDGFNVIRPSRQMFKTNVYDSMISYKDNAEAWGRHVQNASWQSDSPISEAPIKMPTLTKPASVVGTDIYNIPGEGGFYCTAACYTQMNSKLYIVNPQIVNPSLESAMWPTMIQFDMDPSVEDFVSEDDIAQMPNNYYLDGTSGNGEFDTLSLTGEGCTTNNGKYIYHFNHAGGTQGLDKKDNSVHSTFRYDPDKNEWSLMTANPFGKFNPACAASPDGRYIYLIGGTTTSRVMSGGGLPSLSTDRYDTELDMWTQLGSNANYPEKFGRDRGIAITDSTTNSIIVTGGYIQYLVTANTTDDHGQLRPGTRVTVPARKVEIFRLDNEDWLINEDVTDDLYLPSGGTAFGVVKVDNFAPNGEDSDDCRADTLFLFGSGQFNEAKNDIQMLSSCTFQEKYSDDEVTIQAFKYDDNGRVQTYDIEEFAYDPWQRHELKFEIVIPDSFGYVLNDSWYISFEIMDKDGTFLDLGSVNEKYDSQMMTRPSCTCTQNDTHSCPGMPDNVRQITTAELLIPSRRKLNNGYCADKEEAWIFGTDQSSAIRLTASDGVRNLSETFSFSFFGITTFETDKESGCYVRSSEDKLFGKFEIQCYGYKCTDWPNNGSSKCPTFPSLGRDIDGNRQDAYSLQNDIEYNILMNDVLLAPGAYAKQTDDDSIVGTQALNTDTLVALIRARTQTGWFEDCFESFFINETAEWDSLDDVLDDKSDEEIWNDMVKQLNSPNSTDVIAGFSVLNEIVSNPDAVAVGKPEKEITKAIENALGRTDLDDVNTTIADITTTVALIDLLTSNPDIIEPDTAVNVTSEWLPDALDKVSNSGIGDDDSTNGDGDGVLLAERIQKVGGIGNSAANNVLGIPNLNATTKQKLIVNVNDIAGKELNEAWTNETIIHIRNGTKTKGTILPKDEPCEYDGASAVVAQGDGATNSDILKCTITITDDDDVAVDLYEINGTRVYKTNSSCFPYYITMRVPSSFEDDIFEAALNGDYYNQINGDDIQYPSCTFWNTSMEEFDTQGCWVYEFDANSVTCACTHLTTFKLFTDKLDPKAQTLSADDWKYLTVDNITKYPVTWVTMLMIVVVLVVACVCVPNNNADKPIIAFEDIIYKEFRDQYLHKHQQWHEIQQIDRWYSKIEREKKELSVDANSNLFDVNGVHTDSAMIKRKHSRLDVKKKESKYYCLLSMNLFKTYLKNDHTVLSVFQRSDGTNYSTKQRIAMFLLYMYMIMMADAIFYGNQLTRRPMGDLAASALVSLIGTCPVYLIRVLFQWSKPRVVKSAKRSNVCAENPLFSMSQKRRMQQKLAQPLVVDAQSPTAITPMTSLQDTNSNTITPFPPQSPFSQATESPQTSPYSPSTLALKPGVTNSILEEDELDLKEEEFLAAQNLAKDNERRISTTYWNAIAELKKSSHPDMRLVRKCMQYVNTKAAANEKASLASEIRLILFNYNYPFPHWYKKMAWILLVIMCIVCVVLSVLYGIQFDVKHELWEAHEASQQNLAVANDDIPNKYGECWEELSHRARIEYEINYNESVRIQAEQEVLLTNSEPQAGDFTFIEESAGDSTKWVLSVLLSFLTSVFIWQPLTIYILTWMKIWAFHNGLIMEASLYNIFQLLCCCCCRCKNKKKYNQHKEMMEFSTTASNEGGAGYPTSPKKTSYVREDSEVELSVSSGFGQREDRALDLIGFLCNDDLFVDLPDDFEASFTQ